MFRNTYVPVRICMNFLQECILMCEKQAISPLFCCASVTHVYIYIYMYMYIYMNIRLYMYARRIRDNTL